ncbi:FAR1 DNA binding domain, zinc finger, SWIM-type, MULE transposase domain containing protein, partial [Tanacetum coccineum]
VFRCLKAFGGNTCDIELHGETERTKTCGDPTPTISRISTQRLETASHIIRDTDIIDSIEYCIDKLASNIEELTKYRDRLQDIKSKVDTDLTNQHSMSDREVISYALGVSKPSKVKIRNPLKSTNKGDRSNSRIIPSKERAMTDGAKKRRKCNNCGDLDADHDSRNCPKPKKTLQQKSNMPGA